MLLQVKCVLAVDTDKDVTDEQVLKGLESTLPGTTLVGTTGRNLGCMIDDIEDIDISHNEDEEALLQAEAELDRQNKERGK